MDFITQLLVTKKHNDSIMVVIEKLTKETQFIRVKSTHKGINIAEIFRMHGQPKTIIYKRETKFTFKFLKILFNGLDT